MSTIRSLERAGLVAVLLGGVPAGLAQADDDRGRDDVHLSGRAVLAAETLAAGPPAGAFFGSTVINGIPFPRPAQPVAGFSGVVTGRVPGEYLVLADNGFGTKANSADFLIRAYFLTPDFETVHGGGGDVVVGDHVSFRDPSGVIGFPIVREATAERLLTGADIDPESIQRGPGGDLWIGDEFGPWILHFDAAGRLLEPPIELPDGLRSPSNPHLGTSAPTVNGSRGIEAMAISPNGRYLTVVLEGRVPADADRGIRRVYRYDTATGAFSRLADYRVTAASAAEADARFVADVQAIDGHRLLVLERDGGRGLTATFRSVYTVDLRLAGPDGALVKEELVDLAAIPDPHLLSLPPRHPGDVGLGDPFVVACESIEALHVRSHATLLLGCDNNLPNTGRNPGRADDSELILVTVPGLAAGRG